MSFAELLAAAGRAKSDDLPKSLGLPEAQIDTLKERYAALTQRTEFRPGDIVMFKDGFDPRREPWCGQPALILDTDLSGYPASATVEDGSATRRVDVAYLSLDPDGDAPVRLTDSRFLRPYAA